LVAKVVSAKEAGENLRRVLGLLLRDIELLHVALADDTPVDALAKALWTEGKRERTIERSSPKIFSFQETRVAFASATRSLC
jgi:hypothetical protein